MAEIRESDPARAREVRVRLGPVSDADFAPGDVLSLRLLAERSARPGALGVVRRALDEPVNLYDPERLRATSERDLFASALLSPRVSAAVFRAIGLERLPTFVGEEVVNGTPYLVAAAPVRTGGVRLPPITSPATGEHHGKGLSGDP